MAFVRTRQRAIARARAFLSLAFGLVACGGGGSDPVPVERTSAQKQCDSLMSSWCENSLACVQAGASPDDRLTDEELAAKRELCLDEAKRTCDAATAVTDAYDACQASVEPLESVECEAILDAVRADEVPAMPSSCDAIFTFD
ncbi:MAG TPA: hypothetical protein VMS65_02295 [Polyangiaceae bacterium]|nr:hypothetical protein [Polyangiaceae bacterium]